MENNISEKVLEIALQVIACLVFTGLVFIITNSTMRNRIIAGIIAVISGYILVYLIFFTEISLTYVLIVGAVVSALSLLTIYILVNIATRNNSILGVGNRNTGIVKNVLILFSGLTLLIGVFYLLDKEILIGVVLWLISLILILSISIFNGGGEIE